MSVFTLPSYPYVFKVIKDRIAASKETTAAKVKQKYALVKHHDRAGRMTDILEYSDAAFRATASPPTCLRELRDVAPSQVEEDGDRIIIRHLYIERRMTAAQHVRPVVRRRAARARSARIRRCDPRACNRQHLRRRPAVQEFRRHALWPRRVLRLRRDRVPGRHPLRRIPAPPRASTKCRGTSGTRSSRWMSFRRSSRRSC